MGQLLAQIYINMVNWLQQNGVLIFGEILYLEEIQCYHDIHQIYDAVITCYAFRINGH